LGGQTIETALAVIRPLKNRNIRSLTCFPLKNITDFSLPARQVPKIMNMQPIEKFRTEPSMFISFRNWSSTSERAFHVLGNQACFLLSVSWLVAKQSKDYFRASGKFHSLFVILEAWRARENHKNNFFLDQ
jgi:hypothetical protein